MVTTTTTTNPSWDDLAAANQRVRQSETLKGVAPHQPEVAVLTCADARVSPARMFDLPPGPLFVVRVAGASATVEAVASLMDDPGPLGDSLRDGRAAAHGAVVDLADGSLTRLDT